MTEEVPSDANIPRVKKLTTVIQTLLHTCRSRSVLSQSSLITRRLTYLSRGRTHHHYIRVSATTQEPAMLDRKCDSQYTTSVESMKGE